MPATFVSCEWSTEIIHHRCVLSCSVMSNSSVNLWTVACQASLSMQLFKQGYLGGFLFPSPGDLSYPGIEPVSLLCLLPCRLILHPLSYRENCLVDCLCDSFSDGHFHTSFDHLGTSTHAHGLSSPLGKDGMHVWAPKQDLLFSKDMLPNNYWHPSYQQQR